MTDSVIQCVDVKKEYRMGTQTVHALSGVSFEIQKNDYVAIMGPSGSGKSTMMNMIGCLDTPSSGSYILNGTNVNTLSDNELAAIRNKEIGFVFQTFNLLPRSTALANVELPLIYAGMKGSARRQQAIDVLEKVGLADRMHHKPNELSGGQRQRVATGRAIVRNPSVFLFDEPLSNLDAKLRVQMRSEIRELQKRLGVTTVYVTHDQIEAMTMADRIVVLRDGRVEQVGTPLDLYDHPANAFVATFIGSPSMNMLTGTVKGGQLRLLPDFYLPLPEGVAATPIMTLGLRPDQIGVAAQPSSGAFAATVVALEATGSETMLFATVAGHRLTVLTKDRLALTAGATVWLSPDLTHSHLFAADGTNVQKVPA